MKDKQTLNRTTRGRTAYVYTDANPNNAEFKGHYALNDEGIIIGRTHVNHTGKNNPVNNLCAMSQNGRYNYPTFDRLLPAIEVFDTSGNSVGYRFEYR